MSFVDTSGKLKAVTFSFDDGVTQDIRLIELLNKYNLKCTFNLNSELLAAHNTLIREGKRISCYTIHPDNVKEIYNGHEVAVHSLTHPDLTECDDDEVVRQVEQDRLNLQRLVGYEVVGMAYPMGGVDARVANLIRTRTGVKYCRTVDNTGSFDIQDDLYTFNPNAYHIMDYDRLMTLGNRFVNLKPDKPQIFYIWGHSYEFDYHPDAWIKMENFCRLIANRDDIFYGTNSQVLL